VNEPGNDILADAALAGDEQPRIEASGAIDFLFDRAERSACSNEHVSSWRRHTGRLRTRPAEWFRPC
jgi:hypothetical protein